MRIRPFAVAWLEKTFNIQSRATYTSKYYVPEHSWTGRDAWWVEIPEAILEIPSSPNVHLVLQAAPDAEQFHYLQVPASFLQRHLPKLTLRNGKVSLFLSAEPSKRFVDQRGTGKVSFRTFLQK